MLYTEMSGTQWFRCPRMPSWKFRKEDLSSLVTSHSFQMGRSLIVSFHLRIIVIRNIFLPKPKKRIVSICGRPTLPSKEFQSKPFLVDRSCTHGPLGHAKQQFNLLAGCRAHATRKMKCVHNQLRNVKVLVRLWRPPYTTTTTTTTRQQQCISCERSRRSYFYLGFGSHCFFGATCDFSSSARTGRLDNIESLPKTDVADDIMFCFFASHTGFGLET